MHICRTACCFSCNRKPRCQTLCITWVIITLFGSRPWLFLTHKALLLSCWWWLLCLKDISSLVSKLVPIWMENDIWDDTIFVQSVWETNILKLLHFINSHGAIFDLYYIYTYICYWSNFLVFVKQYIYI